MARRVFVFVVAAGMAVMAAACESAPKAAVDEAGAAVDQANVAGAGEYAPDAMEAAQEARAALDAELEAQQGKWFKSYARTAVLAAETKTAGNAAMAAVAEGKERAKTEASVALEGAKTLLAEVHALLEKAPKGRADLDLEALKAALETSDTAIEEGEKEMAGGRFIAAKAQAEGTVATAMTVRTAIETATGAKGQR